LPDVVRLWDSFIGDPSRFDFVTYTSLAMVLSHRDDIMHTEKQFALAELLQSAPRRCAIDGALRRAYAICAFERRSELPIFPQKTPTQVVDDLSEWAQIAAVKVQEVGKSIQENVAPIVIEKTSQAQQAAAEWLEETAPARREVLEKAHTQLSSLWGAVRATGAAAAFKGQKLASEYTQAEVFDSASSTLSSAADGAVTAASVALSTASVAASAASVTASQFLNRAIAPSR